MSAWWRDAVIYQLYLRSFADGDGDGVGDLRGLLRRLDYLRELGVDGFWLNPCYPSPHVDHGYDVAYYTDIDPGYGDLDTFDTVLEQAHARGLKVLLDLVPNHCSAQHPWFRAALAAPPGSPQRARFVFREGRGPAGELPPNNWLSMFGGPAWTRVTDPDGTPGQWYLHLFDPAQPDFDWRNPEVVEFFDEVLRFWFDRGVDGFRIDVANGLLKHPELPDWHGEPPNPYAWNRSEVHEIYRRWRRIADAAGAPEQASTPRREITLLGEIWEPGEQGLASFLRPGELSQVFFFDLLLQPWNARAFRESIDRAFAEIGPTGTPITWTLANHDVHRAVSRYGLTHAEPLPPGGDPLAAEMRPLGEVDEELGARRARAAVLLLLALPGSVYLYQGEELGLPEVLDLPDEHRQDPLWTRSGGTDRGRDGCRLPLPWRAGSPETSFGFTDAGSRPWLPQPGWFDAHAVDAQLADERSTLNLHRSALELRRRMFSATTGEQAVTWLPTPGVCDVLALRHGDAVCAVNFGDVPVSLPPEWGDPVLRSESAPATTLPPNAAAWLA